MVSHTDSETITAYCRWRSLPDGERIALLVATARVVDVLHRRASAHGRISPSAVMVTPDGTPHLLMPSAAAAGAEDYTAPEQRAGRHAGAPGDVYALGLLAHHLVARKRPPHPLRNLPITPGNDDLGAIIGKALHDDPGRRYSSAGELADDLDRWRQRLPVRARRSTAAHRMRLFAGRHRASFAVATGLVLSVVVGRGWLLPSAAPPAAAPVAIASRLAAQASGLARRGRPEEARALYARAVRSLDATVPATDPVRLAIMDSLARTLNDLALWDEAFRVAREALNRARLTANDSLLAVARLRVALIEENIPGRLPSAEAGLREALTLLRASHPPNHALVVEATRKLAVVLSVQGHTPTALAVLDSAIARNTARGNLPDAAYLTGQRVPILLRAGRPREAQRSAEVARTRLEELPEASTKRADVQLWSAMAEMQAGKFDAATEDLSAANAGYQRRYSARHPRRAMVNCALGSSLVLSERGTDGDSLIQDACPRYEEWSLAHPSIDRWRRKAARKLQRVQ